MVGAAVMWLAAATGLLPMAFSAADTKLGPWTTPWWVPLAGLVVLATVLAYVSGIMAARALGSKVASFVSLTEVLFAVIWAWLLLGELPGAVQLLGGVLIVGGVILVRLDELHTPAAAPGDGAATTAGKVARAHAASPLEHANDVEPVP
jgi:drug/metabolite transporter (DMT)-like permease